MCLLTASSRNWTTKGLTCALALSFPSFHTRSGSRSVLSIGISSSVSALGTSDCLLAAARLANARRYSASLEPVCSTSESKYECGLASSAEGVSNSSTCPCPKTYRRRETIAPLTERNGTARAYQDSITIDDRSQPMRDGQNGACFELISNGFLYQLIRTKCRYPLVFSSSPSTMTYALSTLAVASSITRTLLLLRMALAKQISCFWPTLRFDPFSLTCESNPLDMISLTTTFSCT